jgi:hypothetical protein
VCEIIRFCLRKKIAPRVGILFYKKKYKTDRFLSWDNVDGSGPLKSLLSMYLQIKDRYHVSFKNMVTILNEKDAVTATK